LKRNLGELADSRDRMDEKYETVAFSGARKQENDFKKGEMCTH
jgi:hypothetical protein